MPRRAAPPAPSDDDLIRFAVDYRYNHQLKVLLATAKQLGLVPLVGLPGAEARNGFDHGDSSDSFGVRGLIMRRNRRNGGRDEKLGKPGPKPGKKGSRPKRYPARMMVRLNADWNTQGVAPRQVKIFKALQAIHGKDAFMKGAAKAELRKKLKGVHVTGDITLLMDQGAIVPAPDAPLPAVGDYRKALRENA